MAETPDCEPLGRMAAWHKAHKAFLVDEVKVVMRALARTASEVGLAADLLCMRADA